MKDPERDQSLERALARALRSASSPQDCPDAETLAAWNEDGLDHEERSRLERHVSNCARCQTQLAAVARMQAGERVVATGLSRLRRSWIVPLAGAAAAAGLWFVVQSPSVPPVLPEAPNVQAPAEEQAPARVQERLEPSALARRARQSAESERKQESARDTARKVRPSPPPPPAALQAPVPSAGEERVATSTARAQDALAIGGLEVERAADGRVSWDPRSSALLAQVTAGASPAASIIWLVGREGLVLLTTDGQTWNRRPFPEPVDLTAVEARSAGAASVIAADGRVFTTADGGATWIAR